MPSRQHVRIAIKDARKVERAQFKLESSSQAADFSQTRINESVPTPPGVQSCDHNNIITANCQTKPTPKVTPQLESNHNE